MRIRSIAIGLLCLLMICVFVGCRKAPAQTEEDPTTATTVPTTMTTVPVIDEKLGDMLTAQEISDALGTEMGVPAISGQGTILTSIGVGSKTVLNVEVSERPIAIFYSMLRSYTDLQACPNLGETAWFSPIHNQLLVYGDGFMITVEVTGTDDADQNVQRLRCRQIAALLLEHL